MAPRIPKFTEHLDSDNLPNEGQTLDDILLEHDLHVACRTSIPCTQSSSASSHKLSNSNSHASYDSNTTSPSSSQNSSETSASNEECNQEAIIVEIKLFAIALRRGWINLRKHEGAREKERQIKRRKGQGTSKGCPEIEVER